MNILIYNEGEHDKHDWMKKVYPAGIHGALKEALESPENNISIVTLDTINEGITPEILAKTDVMLWWGMLLHHMVPDAISDMVKEAVQMGMGIIFLHSAHMSKPFRALLGTSWHAELA